MYPKLYRDSLIKGTVVLTFTRPLEGAILRESVCVQFLDDTIECQAQKKLTFICASAFLPGYVGTLW